MTIKGLGKVLVTGGAGFIGSHLSRRLITCGYQVTIVDNLSTGLRENVPPEAVFLELDLSQPNSIHKLPAGPYQAVCHLAGQSSGEHSFHDSLCDLDANARSTLLLSRWALEKNVPVFLHASSMGVYGQVDQAPVPETRIPRPISYYGASKYSAEQILHVAACEGLRTVSFRMFSVYGPGQNLVNMKQGMVSIYLAFLLKNEPLIVKGPLSRIRDFVYIDDVVRAWELALNGTTSGVFNVGSGNAMSVGALIDKLLFNCGLDRNYPVREVEGTPGDQNGLYADITQIRNVLGWEPRTPLREGLAKTVAWAGEMKRRCL